MISLLAYQVFISITCFNAGYCFYSLFGKQQEFSSVKYSVLLLFTGLVTLTLLCQIIVLFLPVNAIVAVVLFLLFQIVALRNRKEYYGLLKKFVDSIMQLPLLAKLGLITTTLLLLLLTTGPTLMDDTESYHIQMVKWIQEYGTVPGIANLHERYGFNSSWFSSVALFSLPSQYNYYTVLNCTISVWLSLYLWVKAAPANVAGSIESKKTGSIALLLLGLLLFLWPLLRGNVSTVNYDFITAAMILILFLESRWQPMQNNTADYSIEHIIWPGYFFTVRIINFPLLLLSLLAWIALVKKGNKRAVVFSTVAGIALVLPFLIRNVLLAGYAFFPSPYLNFFNVDWKADPKVIEDLLYYIKYYNRVNNVYQPLKETAALSFPGWLRPWYHFLLFYDKILVVVSGAGFLCWLLLKQARNKIRQPWLIVLFLQLLLWFIVAPDPRFVYGPLLCGAAVGGHLLFSKLNMRMLTYFAFGTMGVLICFTTVLFASKLLRDKRYCNPFVSQKLPQPSVQTVRLGTVDLYMPERMPGNWNPRCYATQLPCLYKIDPRLHLRGTTIKGGFSVQ